MNFEMRVSYFPLGLYQDALLLEISNKTKRDQNRKEQMRDFNWEKCGKNHPLRIKRKTRYVFWSNLYSLKFYKTHKKYISSYFNNHRYEFIIRSVVINKENVCTESSQI